MDEIALTPFQQAMADLIPNTAAPGKHSARSAILHIQKAWRLRNNDPEMAAFRALTGEEEAVTAVFHTLVRRKYDGAAKLRWRNHIHKWAALPFYGAVAEVFLGIEDQIKQFSPKAEIDEVDGETRVRLRIDVPGGTAYPVPPLNLHFKVNGKAHDYKPELNKIAHEASVKTILRHIENKANLRNRILYASSVGVPAIEGDMDKHLLKRRDNIFRNLMFFLLIDPYPERQPFVQDCLNAFLGMLDLLPHDDPWDVNAKADFSGCAFVGPATDNSGLDYNELTAVR